jgi:hypothetical protein
MATRAQIDRIARQVDKLASTLNEANTTYVPLYDTESEAEALKAYGEPDSGSVVFNRARQGDRREDCDHSGMDVFYRLGPSEVRRLIAQIDGTARGVPTKPPIES